MRRVLQRGVGVLALGLALTTLAAPAPRARAALQLRSCPARAANAWCGRLARPLDVTGKVPGTLSIYFEVYPATGPAPAAATLVATEGGPGYAATDSAADYLALFAPLRADHDVVIMDNRGTGRSGAVDCPALRRPAPVTALSIGRCGDELGARASWYGTAAAADDLEAILTALGRGTIDLYGDSYGTLFAQVFGLLHPQRLRSLVLDGAYPLDGPDIAWLPEYAKAMRTKFNTVCARSPACAALPGTSMDRLTQVLQRLRLASPAATAPPRRGLPATPAALATTLFGSAPSLTTLREADAAARAYLAGDSAPLTRLMRQAHEATDSRDPHGVRTYSAGLAAAVSCGDTPQLFDRSTSAAARRRAFERLIRAHDQIPDAAATSQPFAPFTIDEFLGLPPDYAYIAQCLYWPAFDAAHVPAYRLGATHAYPSIPVLVLSGELDNITSPAEGAAAAAAYRQATHVVLANSLHVNALPHARGNCGATLVRRFISTLAVGDIACASAVPAVRLAASYARLVSQVAPATGQAGNQVDERGLRLAAATLASAADALPRLEDAPRVAGLRGGDLRIRHTATGRVATLNAVRWCADLAVSGTLRADELGGGTASLRFTARDGTRGELEAHWPGGGPAGVAELHGMIGGQRLAASVAAP